MTASSNLRVPDPMNVANAKPILALPFFLLAANLANAADLKPYTASYELVRNGDTIGNAVFTLKQTPAGWDYQSTSKGTHGTASLLGANVDEGTRVSVDAGRIELRDYHYRLSSLVKAKNETLVADSATHRIAYHDNKRDNDYPMQPGVVDKLSLTLAIAQDLANGKRGILNYPVAGRDRIDEQRFNVGKEESLTVPAGPQRAIVVSRLLDGAKQKSTTYWFGLDNGFVPVRIVFADDSKDETDELRLVSLRR
jgi:hypothetical protein